MAEQMNMIDLKAENGIMRLTLNQPDKAVNTLGAGMLGELEAALGEVESRDDLKVLVIQSGKPGCFVAGADLREIAGITDISEAAAKAGQGQELLNRIEDLKIPSVAIIDGTCLGGGLELALACNYRVVSDGKKTNLGLPETTLGIVPGFGGTYRLPRTVGLEQAVGMILRGKPVNGKKAYKIGLADAFYPQAFLYPWADKLIEDLARGKTPRLKKRTSRKPLARRLLENTAKGRSILLNKAEKNVRTKTGGAYPAPLEAIELLRHSYGLGRDKALSLERETIGKLIPTRISKNLIQLYFSREGAKKHPALMGEGELKQVTHAAILGAGVMGGRIAWLFSDNDIPVTMKDIALEQIKNGYASAAQVYKELKKRGKYTSGEINLKMHQIHGTLEYKTVGRPDAVVEAVVENKEIKKKVLSELETYLPDDTIIATNTSALSVSELATALKRPDRFVGMHFFNPVNRMPLVEIIPGEKTSPETVRSVGRLALRLGKTPVFVSNCAGFLVNRLLMPYLNEAVELLAEGADMEDVDRKIMAFGMPMGPYTLLDEIGIDVARDVAETLNGAYPDRMQTGSFFENSKDQEKLLGKKSGKGFYLYSGNKKPNPEIGRMLGHGKSAKELSEFDIVHRPILNMANEAARALEEKVVNTAEELDLAMVLGTGFPPFRGGILRYVDELGLDKTVETLQSYAERFGSRFEPAPLLFEKQKAGEQFYR